MNFDLYINSLNKTPLTEAVIALYEASEGDARKYMKKALIALGLEDELRVIYGENWSEEVFVKLRKDFVRLGCDMYFLPGIARIAYGELDLDSNDEQTQKVTDLRDLVKFISRAHKGDFTRNLERIDDDSPAHEDFVEKMMELHNKDTKRVIYGYHMVPHNLPGIDCVRYGVALYPPKSLFPLDEHFGRKFFKDMDDEYMRLLHVLAGTQYFEIKASDVLCIQAGAQDVAMQRIMANQWGEIRGMWDTLFAAMPELKKLWDKNVVKRN